MISETPTFDICKMVEKSPLTRLKKEYSNKFLKKIQDNFNEKEQRFFVANFFAYLNYDSKKDFVINFDDVWKWVGFTRKDNAKRLLDKYFVPENDFCIKNDCAPPIGGAHPEQGCVGLNKQIILLSVTTFKKFCMKANTKQADEIHDYYIKLEELLQETINEETTELRQQLELKTKENQSLSSHLLRKYTKKYDDGNCIYLVTSSEKTGYFKIGHTKDIEQRLVNLSTSSPYVFEVIELYYTEFNEKIENMVKEMFARHRISVSCEFYVITVIDEIKSFIKGLVDHFDIYKMNSHVNYASENKDSIIGNETNAHTLYILNEKKCKTCNEILKITNFFCIDTARQVFQESCINCYNIEHNDTFKRCTKCSVIKSTSEFIVDRTKKDGYTYECKMCRYQQIQIQKEINAKKNPNLGKIQCVKCDVFQEKKMFYKLKVDELVSGFVKQCKTCYEAEFGPSKQCFTCNDIKSKTNFSITKANTDGFSCYCKSCMIIKRNQEREQKKLLEDPHKDQIKCKKCDDWLKHDMFFKKYVDIEKKKFEYYEECLKCVLPLSNQCSRCKEVKEVIFFSKDKDKKTGYRTMCRECTSISTKSRVKV